MLPKFSLKRWCEINFGLSSIKKFRRTEIGDVTVEFNILTLQRAAKCTFSFSFYQNFFKPCTFADRLLEEPGQIDAAAGYGNFEEYCNRGGMQLNPQGEDGLNDPSRGCLVCKQRRNEWEPHSLLLIRQ